jgi:DNA helicase II / ATP-dependent DNA helicase PcrA
MSWDTDLTGIYRDIAASDSNRIRVMAGPGTGKTFAMKRRIARLLEVDHVPPNRILAVTFTRTAAADLKHELHELGIPGCQNIRAGTLHAYCFHLLLRNEVFGFLSRVPRGLVSFDKSKIYRFEIEPLIEDISVEGPFGPKREITRRIRAFEADWARLQHEQPGWPVNPVDQLFHERLIGWLRFHKGMLIGELVPTALHYLRNNPASPALQVYDHIVVDEYQDLNRAEQELLDLLARNRCLSIVGDIDQSIYRFRYAHPGGIVDFSNRHQHVEDFALNECRRCREDIVSVADCVILRNYPPGESHRLVPLDTQPGPATIRVVQWPSLTAEADGIGSFIEHLVNEEHFVPGEILVLSPRRLIANRIKQHLAGTAPPIPAHSFYNDKLLEPLEVQLGMTKLQLLCQPEDRVSLRFWLGVGSPSWRFGQYSRLREHCEEHSESPRSVLERVLAGELELPHANQLISRFEELQREMNRLAQLDVTAIFDDLFPADMDWAQPIRELLTAKIQGVDSPADLLDLLRTEITQPEMPAEGNFVRIMSMHKSKGLTSRVTIIVGCVHGLIPYIDDDISPADWPIHIQEQRRVFYVALTRPKEILVISSAATLPRRLARQLGAIVQGGNRYVGHTVACEFIDELGSHAPDAQFGPAWAEQGFP